MSENGIRIEIYSRPGCHLCDEAKEVIDRVGRHVPLAVSVINIDNDSELQKLYGEQIPVVFINARKAFKYQVDEAELEKKAKKLWKP